MKKSKSVKYPLALTDKEGIIAYLTYDGRWVCKSKKRLMKWITNSKFFPTSNIDITPEEE